VTDLPRRRLHPLSPFLRSIRQLVGLIAIISWQGFAQLGLERFLGVVAIILIGAVVVSVVAWRYTGYEVVGRELRIHEGLLSRRTRAIPLERLQSAEVVRPLLAQLSGLAELRLEVVGGGKAEAPLAYLTVADAQSLRTHILALAAGTTAETAPEPEPERPLYQVRDEDLILSQVLAPEVAFVPVAAAIVVIQFATAGSFGFIAIASTITALLGVILRPVRRLTRNWRCTLTLAGDRLHVRRGLTETTSQVVPVHRIQAVNVTWPLLWRPKRWVRMTLDIAAQGARGANPDDSTATTLVPVASFEQVRAIVPLCVPGVDILSLPLSGVPDRAAWVAPLARTVLAAGATEHAFATVEGVLSRRLRVVPYARIQSVRVRQGWLQQRLRLATVYVDIAGAPAATAAEWDVSEAFQLARELTKRAQTARAALSAPSSAA
jgi:putative membrane protein